MLNRLRVASVVVALFGLAFAASARATTYCVNFSAGQCTGTQKSTIAGALTAAGSHSGQDTVKIAGGHTYSESPLVTQSDNSVSIIGTGSGAGRPVIAPGNPGQIELTLASSTSTISNVTFSLAGSNDTGLRFDGTTASKVNVAGSGATDGAIGVDLRAGVLSDSTIAISHSSTVGSTGVEADGDSEIDDSTVSAGTGVDNAASTVTMKRDQITAPTGVQAIHGGITIVQDSLVVTSGAVPHGGVSIGLSLLAQPGDNASASIQGATIYNQGSGQYGVYSGSAGGPEGVTIDNTISRNFGTAGIHANGGSQITSDYSDYGTGEEAGGGTFIPGAHDVDLAPAFANAAGGDYHLTGDSPLVDKGDPAGIAAGESKTDVYGAGRLIAPSPAAGCPRRDIGAAELRPSPLVPPHVSFTAPATAQVGKPVSFDASKSCASSSGIHISDYSWEFGDGFGGSGEQVTHTYQVPGTRTVQLTVVDSAGHSATAPAQVDVKPADNHFKIGKPKLNKQKGTAKLPVTVPGPGELKLKGDGLVTQSKASAKGIVVAQAGTVKLKVKPKGKTKRKLKQMGKVTVKAKITFSPTGGDAKTKPKTLTLKRKTHGK